MTAWVPQRDGAPTDGRFRWGQRDRVRSADLPKKSRLTARTAHFVDRFPVPLINRLSSKPSTGFLPLVSGATLSGISTSPSETDLMSQSRQEKVQMARTGTLPEQFSLATYNVNSVRARAEILEQWLHRLKPDILCLQETKVVDDQFPHDLFRQFGYYCAVHGQPGYNGVAICSRWEPDGTQRGVGSFKDEQARVLTARFGRLEIVNLYVPHGDLPGTEKFVYKMQFLRALRLALEEREASSEWLVVVGDMNVARTDRDVWDPMAVEGMVGVLPEEREAFEELLAWGLIDCYRELYPTGSDFTWWDYRGGAIWKNAGMRIDYVLATPPIAPACKTVRVDLWPRRRRKPTPSDHAPVIAEFDLRLARDSD